MITKIEDWYYSSFKDYTGLRKGTLCYQKKAYELLSLDKEFHYNETYETLGKNKQEKFCFKNV